MKLKALFIVLFLIVLPFIFKTHKSVKNNTHVEKAKEIEYEWSKDTFAISHLLVNIPKNQRNEFIQILYEFAEPRCIDWRLIILLMYNESHVNTTTKSGNYAGLIMFGPDALKTLKITQQELLNCNYVQQAKYAVQLWNYIESWGKSYKIKDFISLQLANFYPAWIPYKGDPYPAPIDVIEQNSGVVQDSLITRESILNFYRDKIKRTKELHFFIERV